MRKKQMKIKIKRKLLNENKLHLYSNIWKRWKSIDDINEWSRSQVLALAKHKKGQGKFNFKFHDKVYQDLKNFIEAIGNENNYKFRKRSFAEVMPSKLFPKNNIFSKIYLEVADNIEPSTFDLRQHISILITFVTLNLFNHHE